MFTIRFCLRLLLILIIFLGCASERKDWEYAKNENSIIAYERFLERYPKSEFSGSAMRSLLILKRKSITFNEAIKGHWKKDEIHIYYGENEKIIQSPNYQFSGEAMPYQIKGINLKKNSITYTSKEKAIVKIGGIDMGWGPVVEIDVIHLLIFDSAMASFDCFSMTSELNDTGEYLGNWTYVDNEYPVGSFEKVKSLFEEY